MRQTYTYIIIICLTIVSVTTQLKSQNLIRNGSFEDVTPYTTTKMLASTNNTDFDKNIRYWSSPTGSSPDIILDEYRGKVNFERKGLDLKPCLPRTGKSVVAIRAFGCYKFSTHCREYIQAKTKQTLKKGCTYNYEFYAQPAVSSIRINNLGNAFTELATNDHTNTQILKHNNAQPHEEIIFSKIGAWVKVSGEYTMEKDCDYIMIGNFFSDNETKHRKIKGGMREAYYLIDDVSVSFKSCSNNISSPHKTSNTITLNDILFDNDSAVLKSGLKDAYQQIINQD